MLFNVFFVILYPEMLELNDVLLEGERSTLSLMAREGQLTCLVPRPSASAESSLRWLYALLGFEHVVCGYISLDGEPLTPASAPAMRRMMSFAPSSLDPVGQIEVYEAPEVQDVFALKANRELSISNGLLSEEMKRTGTTGVRARLLAVAVLLKRPILLVDHPDASSADYLRQQAQQGRIVIVLSDDQTVIWASDNVVELPS